MWICIVTFAHEEPVPMKLLVILLIRKDFIEDCTEPGNIIEKLVGNKTMVTTMVTNILKYRAKLIPWIFVAVVGNVGSIPTLSTIFSRHIIVNYA
jgi:hypothetical protein